MSEQTEKSNGAAGEQTLAQGSVLLEAMNAHAQALVKLRTRPDGKVLIDPMQLLVDLELVNVKVALIVETLAEELHVDPAKLMVRLRDKLTAEAQQLESAAFAQRVAFHSGHAPRKA